MTEQHTNAGCYVVVGSHSWNRKIFDEEFGDAGGSWHFLSRRDELTLENLDRLAPRYLFFMHWSWRVPEEIVDAYECVCFHMTDVPYGRGGSPLQNLIVRGHRETRMTALRMVSALDAGPVYLKRPLSLEGGSAEEIYLRASKLSAVMAREIVRHEPKPVPQEGEPTVFPRRTPEQSRLQDIHSLQELYDHIRMLDAERYPRAFLEQGGFRYEFHRATRYAERVVAEVTITRVEET